MIRLVLVVALVGCSGHASTPARPDPHHHEGSATVATARDCDKLLAHALQLALDERPADQKLDDREREAVLDQMRHGWLAACQQMTQPGYDCALAARSVAELDGCAR